MSYTLVASEGSVRAIGQVFQRFSYLLYSIYALFCVSMLATYCHRWEGMAASTSSSHMNYIRIMLHRGYIHCSACLSIEKTKTKEIKTERGETLKKNCFPVDPTTLTLRRKTDITRAPSTACWLFSRHIAVVSGKSPHYFSGSRSSEAVGIAHSLVACSARIAVDRHTHTHTHEIPEPSQRMRAEG